MAEPTVVNSLNFLKNLNLPLSDVTIKETVQSFRTLRNYCAHGKFAQNFLLADQVILNKTREVVVSVLNEVHTENSNLCLLVALQFVANSLVDNKENQRAVWNNFSHILESCLQCDDPKIRHCTAMIIYNVLLNNEDILKQIDSPEPNIIALTQNEQTSEFAVFILELLIFKTDYMPKQYEKLPCEQRLIILSIIESAQSNEEFKISPEVLLYLGKYFVSKCEVILEAATNGMQDLEAEEIAKILEILNSTSSRNDENLVHLQREEELLVISVGLLRTIHAVSKEQGNQFSMLLKMADLEAESNLEIEHHPGFGFKAGLVRLIGNMCWHNRAHQDTARELGAIPLILDCCNIDARNPLIIQWAVLAMRNLCDNNLENQHVVASVDQEGEVDRSRLAELGLLFNGAGS